MIYHSLSDVVKFSIYCIFYLLLFDIYFSLKYLLVKLHFWMLLISWKSENISLFNLLNLISLNRIVANNGLWSNILSWTSLKVTNCLNLHESTQNNSTCRQIKVRPSLAASVFSKWQVALVPVTIFPKALWLHQLFEQWNFSTIDKWGFVNLD